MALYYIFLSFLSKKDTQEEKKQKRNIVPSNIFYIECRSKNLVS